MSTIDKISTLLKENKKTQKDLMDYLGLEKSTFSAWKANKNTSYKQYISDIAEYFCVSTDYLLGFTDDPIDYENTDEVQNAPIAVINELRDPKKIYDFMKAQEQDAMKDPFEEELPEEIVILNRAAKKMTPEQRKKLLDVAKTIFKEEFDD